MIYIGELLILFLKGYSAYSILLIVLYLLLGFLPCNAKILIACQLLYGNKKVDFILKQNKDGNANALYFLDIEIGLQQLV